MKVPAFVTQLLGRRGDLVALESGTQSWSYAELDEATRERAAQLRRICPDGGRVVLVGEHTAEAVIWALAVLRSGLVHTPLNPNLPVERLREAIRVAAPRLVLCCTADSLGALRAAGREDGLAVRVLGAEEIASAAAAAGGATGGTPSSEVAYSIFTSGSTGLPKLVNVGHAGVENLCRDQSRLFGVKPGSRVLQFSSLSFDASIAEILVALYAGARLVVPPRENGSWLSAVGRYLRDHGCDVITLPPSVYARLDDEARKAIGTVVFAGEALYEGEFRAASRYSRVLNAYGPTEGTVCFSVAELSRFSASVGRPIEGWTARVYDTDTAPGGYAASGRGELVLVGPGVALGYEGSSAASPDGAGPFTTVDGAPAYHTGDEVELRDGEVFYLGRLDEQVKRLGHRIGLGELAGRIAGLLDTSAVLLEDGTSLVLAHTATAEHEGGPKAYLRRQLPPWEVPDVLFALPELPLTDNGKTDRAAVLALVRQAAERASAGADGPTPGAGADPDDLAVVHAVVAGVLGTAIEPATSVFDAGGDSLALVRIQVELSRIYGKDTVQAVFDLLNYDFSVADFITGLRGRSGAAGGTGPAAPPAHDPVPGVFAAVAAELAGLPAELDALRPAPAGDGEQPRGVTLTGAGGFIGGHVLDRLLGAGRHLTVLTTSDPAELVSRHRARFGRAAADYADVEFLGYGDADLLARDAAGGAGRRWGPVVHCGFEVNHLLPLERQLNGSIASTRTLLRAAAALDSPRFVFLSAASVGARFLPFTEDALAAVGDPYSQAKFVAEGYLGALGGERCTVDLVRAGLVYGHTGGDHAFLERDVFAQLLRLSLRHGVLPRLEGLVPVCHVADVVTALLTAAGSQGAAETSVLVQRTYGVEELRAELGLAPDRVVGPQEWLATVTEAGGADLPLLAALRQWLGPAGWSEEVRSTDRPIVRELRQNHLGS
ncbi:AMP-binding protein [Kitasatospora sp. NPDC057223]|uniref:AMP-binding protein n=1 Tax=Kitasatospora sp. NPDC057223 TaxID=3346055 RepID=UPI00362D4D94